MDHMTAVRDFLQDIACLEPVTRSVYKVNIFEVLGTSHTEIRHSNMLAWLMDPKGNHGLGDRVLRGIIRLVSDDVPEDCGGFEIHREWNHIDLLANSETEKYILCIENKTYSGEHSNQLARYREHVETTFPGYRKAYAFLTRKGIASSDPEHWMSMGYREALGVIQEARKAATLKPEVDLILDHYAEAVTEMTGGDDRIRDLCGEIYKKHKRAIDLIMEKGPDSAEEAPEQTEEMRICGEIWEKYGRELREIYSCRPGKAAEPVTEMIRLWTEMKTQEDAILISPENTTDRYFRFTTRTMSDILPDAVGHRSGWKTENFYFYELRNTIRNDEHEVFLTLCVDLNDIPVELKAASDRMCGIQPPFSESRRFRGHFSTNHVFIKSNADEQTVTAQLDQFLSQLTDFEREVAQGMGMTED